MAMTQARALGAPSLAALAAAALASCAVSPGAAPSPAPVTSERPPHTDDPWFAKGRAALAEREAQIGPGERARNVILFVGDGMDVATITAARILAGQQAGGDGEGHALAFEDFPHTALIKTYTTDYQVSDSAGTATALVTGVKTRSGVLSITAEASRGDCASALANPISTIVEQAERAGLATGVVSTASITHATPASVYAHAADRNWEADADMTPESFDADCVDIARQLVEFDEGDGLELALGGGRAKFLPAHRPDPEYPEQTGARQDGRNLANEWASKSPAHAYVWNAADFAALPADAKALGLFEPGHMRFEADRAADGAGEPSIAEMTRFAIERLSAHEDGYFLMVEAGRVDHAHHAGNAFRALTDAIAFSDAVAAAKEITSREDTLIIVTADHGHTMTIAGYPRRGANILGLASFSAGDRKPYTTLGYINGPGSIVRGDEAGAERPSIDPGVATGADYRQQALIPLGAETHGGQDVPAYARGPNAHLVGGVLEQNVLYHVMADALDLPRE